MIKFKHLFETVYEPKSGDEKNFKDKHIVAKYKTPYDTESQFTSDKPKAKRKADHDKGEDEAVYEAAELHTKRADKEPVIVRTVDPKTGQGKAKTVLRRAGEIKIGEEVDLDEKVDNPYAVGMAAAMKATGDRPPLKKSTIVKGHDIAKSIKKEAMDPVGKADADIDNDGDVDKSDKYLHNRRKAIGKALRKEEAGSDDAHYEKQSPKMKDAINMHLRKGKSYKDAAAAAKMHVKEDLDEAVEVRHDRYMRSHGKKARDSGQGSGNWMFTHKSMGDVDYKNDKEVHTARGNFSDAKKSAQKWAKEHGHHSVYVMESVEQIDELSPSTLHSYIKKAAPDVVARTISAVAPNQSAQTKKHASKLGKRISGITSASGRLADKANADQYEEVEQVDEISRDLARRYIRKVADKNNTGEASPKEVMKRSPGVALAGKKVYGIGGKARVNATEEVEMIDEAVKVGAMKLHDGSSIMITRAMADTLNSVFEQLNPANRVKMEQKLHSSKKDFDEIFKFAETVNG